MDLAEGAAHESALLCRDEDGVATESGAANDHAIVELLRQVEDRQMRAGFALFGADDLGESAGIDEGCHALAGARFEPAQGSDGCGRTGHASGSSIMRTVCARRSATVSGPAPPSLMERRRPPAARRATESVTTGSHTAPQPSAVV